jgi:hypothetical protein
MLKHLSFSLHHMLAMSSSSLSEQFHVFEIPDQAKRIVCLKAELPLLCKLPERFCPDRIPCKQAHQDCAL